MSDPYKVLGITREADETEIKKAYRALSKKYHPDNNPGNPHAEEVFKQVQNAYEQIMQEKKNGFSYSSYDYSYRNSTEQSPNFNGFAGEYYYNETNETSYERDLKSAGIYIQNGYYDQALNVLNSVDLSDRDDKWFYYSAIANLGIGNNITALEHAKRALSANPNNYEYQRLVNSIENGSGYYTNKSTSFDINPISGGNWCLKVILINVALNLCCGGSGLCYGTGGMYPYC